MMLAQHRGLAQEEADNPVGAQAGWLGGGGLKLGGRSSEPDRPPHLPFRGTRIPETRSSTRHLILGNLDGDTSPTLLPRLPGASRKSCPDQIDAVNSCSFLLSNGCHEVRRPGPETPRRWRNPHPVEALPRSQACAGPSLQGRRRRASLGALSRSSARRSACAGARYSSSLPDGPAAVALDDWSAVTRRGRQSARLAQARAEMNAEQGSVSTHAQTMRPATPQRTADALASPSRRRRSRR